MSALYIPEKIWNDRSLTVYERIVYFYIYNSTSPVGCSFIKISQISKATGIASQTVNKIIKQLENKGYIKTIKSYNGRYVSFEALVKYA